MSQRALRAILCQQQKKSLIEFYLNNKLIKIKITNWYLLPINDFQHTKNTEFFKEK